MIKNLRVDHRLLHGQVAFSWTSALSADCILIANDRCVNDELQKTTMKMAKPNGVKLVIKNMDDSVKAINSGVTDKYRLFVVTGSIEDACRLAKECNIKAITLGGTKARENTRPISKAVNVTPEQEKLLKETEAAGVDITLQMVPADSAVKLDKAL